MSSTGRVVAASGDELPEDRLAEVLGRYVRAGRLPAVTGTGEKTWSVVETGRDDGERIAHWFPLFASDHRDWLTRERGMRRCGRWPAKR